MRAPPVLGITLKLTELFPLLPAPEVIVSQGALLVAAQAQLLFPDCVRATLPSPPAAGTESALMERTGAQSALLSVKLNVYWLNSSLRSELSTATTNCPVAGKVRKPVSGIRAV